MCNAVTWSGPALTTPVHTTTTPMTAANDDAEQAVSDDQHPDDASGRVQVYRDSTGDWRWRALAPNGDIEADSGEGFASTEAVLRSVSRVATVFSSPRVTGETPGDHTVATVPMAERGDA